MVVAVVGITSELEGEEMQVNEAGFKGGDRTSIDLPQPEENLLQALATAGKPLVVVLTNGSALAVNWANDACQRHSRCMVSGRGGRNGRGGDAQRTQQSRVVACPSRSIPAWISCRPFDDYNMKNRTYRYFQGTPLYPFGYGLSYTSFSYSGLRLPETSIKAGEPLEAEVTVTNTGRRAGDEVAQLYLNFPPVAGAPLKALRGFARMHLEAGASQAVTFKLAPRDMSMVTEAGEPIVAAGEYTVSSAAASQERRPRR